MYWFPVSKQVLQKIIDGLLTLDATLNRFGDTGDSLQLGFLVDTSPIENPQASDLITVLSNTESESSYSAVMDLGSQGGTYYYLAFAKNEEGKLWFAAVFPCAKSNCRR